MKLGSYGVGPTRARKSCLDACWLRLRHVVVLPRLRASTLIIAFVLPFGRLTTNWCFRPVSPDIARHQNLLLQ